MKTLSLLLPDWAFDKAVELAKTHSVTEQTYVSTLVVERLFSDASKPPTVSLNRPESGVPDPTIDTPSSTSNVRTTFSAAPDTLKQVLMVCAHVYETGDVPKDDVHCNAMYRVAVRKVAKELGIRETTVRDKCSTDRRLGPADSPINQAKFIQWLQDPVSLREHLCQKFLEFKMEIRKQFTVWLPSLPGPFGGPAASPQRTIE